ncbi:MAG TPA: glycosyltransferase family A protein [Chlamydiales bacterium]|nr:glycosyltransferase family A protein [Chlamydiales bacterium]
MWRLILVFVLALGGFWMGRGREAPKKTVAVHPEKEFPVTEHKSFAVVVYAHNQALWCERALRSIFEQEYDHYRILLVDDGSIDGTSEKVKQFIADNNQKERFTLIRSETCLGRVASLYRAIDSCLDREIVIPLDAKDWLAHPMALSKINGAYQNPDVWLALGQGIDYPSYEIRDQVQTSFYAALFKQIRLQDLFKKGHFTTVAQAYLTPLSDMSGGRVRKLQEPVVFSNTTSSMRGVEAPAEIVHYHPLTQFPTAREPKLADILIFSFDRPLQLYACLESVQRYITGFENITVLYRASSGEFAAGYDKVKNAFPIVQFVAQSESDPKHDFKPHVMKIVFDSPSQYILFGVDDIIVKDFVDLKLCMDQMEKTDAYGFYLRFGRHIHHCYQTNQPQELPPSLPLANGVFAWDIRAADSDWAFANSLDMTLFKKDLLKDAFAYLRFKTPNSLEFNWANDYAPKEAIGLYFDHSKLVNVPMNLVGRTGNPHMNYLSTEELLVKFNQGLKIDIEPLYRVENASPHIDYIPEFVLR